MSRPTTSTNTHAVGCAPSVRTTIGPATAWIVASWLRGTWGTASWDGGAGACPTRRPRQPSPHRHPRAARHRPAAIEARSIHDGKVQAKWTTIFLSGNSYFTPLTPFDR